MGWGKQTKGTDGSAQTVVGDEGDHQRGRANSVRRFSRGGPDSHGEQQIRTEMSGGNDSRRNWAQRRAEKN